MTHPASEGLNTKNEHIDVAIMGGTGYVAGELLRLLAMHPRFRVVSVVSTSQAKDPVVTAFPHLAGTKVGELRFESPSDLAARYQPQQSLGIFAATPHGATAELIDAQLTAAESKGAQLHVVDLSADFRFPTGEAYTAIYGHPHPAPKRLGSFYCAPPDISEEAPTRHATQPGCFTTAVTLGAYPFFALGLVEPSVFASAITGSSGSGRKLSQGTHHPERRSALYAYSALNHRHEPEMRMFLSRALKGAEASVEFVPHSGPFVRGIHATLRMTLLQSCSAEALCEQASGFYARSPFVQVTNQLPRLTDVVGTNRARIGIAVREKSLVVTSVIDNLIKGAAGGGVQWMNRLFGLADETGLLIPGLGWY